MRPHIKADGIDRQGFTAIQEGSFFINDFSLIIVVRVKIVIDNVLVSVSAHIVSLLSVLEALGYHPTYSWTIVLFPYFPDPLISKYG